MCLKQCIDSLAILLPKLAYNTSNSHETYAHLRSALSESFDIKEVSGINYKGSYDLASKTITIKSDVSPILKIRTLLHEAVHALDFTISPVVDMPRNQHEIIAEAAAYVVALKLGLDTGSYSINYLRSWMTDEDTKDITVMSDRIQELSYRIILLLAESKDSAFYITEESEDQPHEYSTKQFTI